MRKIKVHNFGKYPTQIYSGLYITMAEYKDKKYNLVKYFQTCRGYIGQGLHDIKNKIRTTSYSYKEGYEYEKGYTYTAVNLAKPENSISVQKNKENFLSEKSLKFIHEIEKQAGVKLSEICKTQEENVYIIISSCFWKNSVWKIMLFTYLIKSMCGNKPGDIDTEYWNNLMKKKGKETYLDIFLKNIKTPSDIEIFDKKIYGVNLVVNAHSSGGFFSIMTGINPPMAKLLGIID